VQKFADPSLDHVRGGVKKKKQKNKKRRKRKEKKFD
jgi:hypothetical protein